MIWMRHTITDH